LESMQIDSCRESKHRSLGRFKHYLHLAESHTGKRDLFLGLTHGVSGTGKSTLGRRLADESGAIQIRSDVERKRLFGLGRLESSSGGIDIYTSDASSKTFARMADLARTVLCAGFRVIVDAVFIKRSLRKEFGNLGKQLDVSFVVLDCLADEKTILTRLKQRRKAGADPSEAALPEYLSQLQHQEPLSHSELARTIRIDTTRCVDLEAIRKQLDSLME
jgi:predicted kinase